MRGGDISNHTAPYVYLHIDDLLYNKVEKNVKIFGIKIATTHTNELNRVFSAMLNHLWEKYDVNIVLFSLNKTEYDREEMEEWLFTNKVVYNRLEFHSDVMSLRHSKFMYLFSDDISVVNVISRKEALHIEKFSEVFK